MVDSKFFKTINWLGRLILINFTFIVFSLMGLIVFGIGPSYYASHKIISDWLNKDFPPYFKTYFKYYKEAFIANNIVMFIYIVALAIIMFNMYTFYINLENSFWNSFGLLTNLLLLLCITNGIIYYPNLKRKFDISFKEAIINSFKLSWAFPFRTLSVYIVITITIIGIVILPQIFLFVIFSPFIFLGSYQTHCMVKKILNIEEEAYHE